uniref:Bifunctional inhibitor/plant lipid transfer protein/seed storage helical domain-containing protein n=1 Tax=Kalanchoe fedtschenkoi TaxID=63787 RepID=A0A7N0VAT9_KALFE
MEFLTSVPIIHGLTPSLLSFVFVALVVTVASASSPPPPAQLAGEDCTGEIVRFSACLPYVSSYPNNISSSASSACCHSFSSAFGSGDGVCFCYLLRQPLVLGFPVNVTRILSLTSVCSPPYASSLTNSSLASVCNASPALPPLHSVTTGPAFTNPNTSHGKFEFASV